MSNRLQQFLRLLPGETGLVLALGLILLGNSLAQQVSDITAVSNFLSAGGVNQILIVWAVDSGVLLLTTGLQSLIIDRFNRVALVRAILLGLGLAFVLLRLLFVFGAPDWLNYALLYLLGQQQWIFFPLVFWILANDIFDMAQAKRLFPLISSSDFAGKLLGIGVAVAAPFVVRAIPGLQTQDLLVLNAAIYFLAALGITLALRKVKIRQTVQPHEPVRETLIEGWGFVKEVPSFRFLALVIIAMLLCDTVIEFRFLVVSDGAFPDPGRYQTFYSLYRLGLTVVAFVLQGFLTSRILAKLTLKNAFFVKPIGVLLGAVAMIVSPGILAAVGGVLLLRIPQYTVDDSARKTFLALVPEERRGRVSIFMDSYLYVVGVLLGCLLTGGIVLAGVQLNIPALYYAYLGLAVVSAALAIVAVVRLRAVYESSLWNWRLKRRQRGKSVLDRLDF